MPLLDARGLIKDLGGRRVVDGVDLQVAAGQVVGLLGPNGAGKTTTMRMLYGYLRLDAGQVTICGHDLFADREAAKRHLGVCTQDDTFDSDFSVAANLLMCARYFRPRPTDAAERCQDLLQRFGLSDFADRRPNTLSGGYRRRVMIARALMARPRVLFLDEPTTGLDPQARRELWRLIDELRGEGLGIVLTTHYMDEAQFLSDHLVIMQAGKVLATGAPAAVLGELVGEQVLVVAIADAQAGLRAALGACGLALPEAVLGQYHCVVESPQLATILAACPDLVYELRKPNLDDLFLLLGAPSADVR